MTKNPFFTLTIVFSVSYIYRFLYQCDRFPLTFKGAVFVTITKIDTMAATMQCMYNDYNGHKCCNNCNYLNCCIGHNAERSIRLDMMGKIAFIC